jgi:hypothetical protein
VRKAAISKTAYSNRYKSEKLRFADRTRDQNQNPAIENRLQGHPKLHHAGRRHRVIRRLIVKKWPSVTFVLGLGVKYLSARDSALSTRFEVPIKS